MNRKLLTSFILLFLVLSVQGQNEGNHWYFGTYAGLDFTSGAPVPVFDGQLTTSEGCSSISDENGNLLFYTDGRNVYDRTHTLMPNGNALLGNPSSTQSAVVCPKPGTYNPALARYDVYVIGTIDFFVGVNGVTWSEVDMTANGGLGDVVVGSKNTFLFGSSTVEGLTFAKHVNGCDYWLIAKEVGNSIWRAYPVTSAGVGAVPVNSNVGPVVNSYYGSIKASPNSQKVALSNGLGTGGVFVYNFNNATGALTYLYGETINSHYSHEFSPNSEVLYAIGLGDPNVYQYDLNTATQAAFVASRLIVGTTNNVIHNYKVGALQIGPDRKIYMALINSGKLGVIDNPDVLGMGCSYVDNAIDITGTNLNGSATQVVLGLPSFPSFFFEEDVEITYTNTCFSNDVSLSIDNTNNVAGFEWFTTPVGTPFSALADGAGLVFNTTLSAGFYDVQCVLDYTCRFDTVYRRIEIVDYDILDLGVDTICYLNTDILWSNLPFDSYSWNTGSVGDSTVVNGPGMYVLEVGSKGPNLINNGDFELGNSGFNTDYTYANSVTTAATYNVVANPNSVNGGFTNCPDNTSGTGNQMVINGASAPLNVWCSQVNVTPNTDYFFSTVVQTVANATSPPNLSFSINSALIGVPFSPVPPLCSWQEFSATWNSGIQTTANICIVENNSSAAGNDFSIDDISFSSICYQKDSVYYKAPIEVDITDNNPLCDPSELNWVELSTVNATSAVGSIGPDYDMTLTHSAGGMSTSPTMFNVGNFPPQYNVPLASAALRNDLAGLMTFCFNTPVSNPQIAFSSIGNPTTPVQIETSEPYNVIWNGTGMTYPDNTTLIGSEGFTIISFPGTHTCISFDYLQSETYCTIAFGIQDTNCQVKPEICKGESVNLTASGALDYVWTPATGLDVTTGANVIASPAVTTTYYAQDANDVGCSFMDSVTIIVHDLPEVVINQIDVCDGNEMTFTNGSIIPLGTIESYAWDLGDGVGTAISTDTVYNYAAFGDYTVSLTAISNEGCVGNADSLVRVYENPLANFDLIDVCAESAYNFNDASMSNEGVIDYWNWDFEDDATYDDLNQNTSHIYPSFGSYDVTLAIANDLGCVDTVTQSITVLELPAVMFTSTFECENVATSFTDLTLANSTGITSWEWDFENDGVIDESSQNPVFIFPAFGTYTTYLSVENDNGCVNDTTFDVVVNPLPVPSFAWMDVCLNQAMTFIDGSSIPIGAIDDYAWDFGDGIGVSTIQNPSYTYLTNGLNTVILTATSDSGCVATASNQVEVWNLPIANFTVSNACDQDAALFTNTSNPNGTTITTVEWDYYNTGTVNFTGFDGSNVYANPGNYFVSQYLTTANGCKDTSTQEVVVFPSPVISFTGQNICQDNSVAFVNNTTINGGLITSYSWDFGNGNTSNVNSPSEFYGSPGVYLVSLLAKSDNDCESTITQLIEVYPTPNPQFIPNNACLGGVASFVDFSDVQSAGTTNTITSWNWDFGVSPVVTSNSQFANYSYPLSGTYTVTLEVTTNHNCTASIQHDVTIHPNPVVDFSSPEQMGCTEFCTDFVDASSVTLGTLQQYYWDLGNGNISTDVNPTICYINETLSNLVYPISLTVTSNEGCATTKTKTNFITVYPLPIADFEPSKYQTTIYQTDIDFANLSTIGENYVWTFDDLGMSNEENPAFRFPYQDSGTYEICLLTSSLNGCLDSICKEIVITPAANVYVPNAFTPNNDGINDVFIPVLSGVSDWEFSFIILDRWGAVLYESKDPTKVEWKGIYQGANVPFDTYVWKMQGVNRYDNTEINAIGHVSVLR